MKVRAARKKPVRNHRDCYLSPPCTARALRRALDDAGWEPTVVRDPFSGPAILTDAFGAPMTIATEIDRMWEEDLAANQRVFYRIQDGFSSPWGSESILTNPPYSLTDAAVEYAVETLQPGRFAALLLRMDWFQHKGRAEPTSLLPLRWRPAFGMAPDKPPRLGTDWSGYAWGVWHDGSLDLPPVLWLDKPDDILQTERARHYQCALRVWQANQRSPIHGESEIKGR